MRAQEYPGSDIVIEAVLDPGVNYSRYYVSYLSEGLKIYALMTVPNGEKPPTGWPVVIFNHGFIPPDVYRTTERYIAYVDLIARSGYIVFRSDYRGHDRSEGEPGGAYSNPGYTVDVLNAVGAMKRYPDADPNRIGMWGHSMGGYITLRSMVVTKDIKAGVIWAGVVASYPDLLARWRRGPNAAVTPTPNPRSWRNTLVRQYGSPEENPVFWRSISANSYVGEISGPIQLHHGTADEDVPLVFSELLFNEMLNANQYAELYTYEGDNHNISNYFSTAMQRTIEFFDRFVKQAG
jgi:dipeptidyl aminopeptidase/acylaminoacyl peptidase